MDAKTIAESLHPLERKVLPALQTHYSIPEIQKFTGLLEVEIMRALQWLKNKELITITEATEEVLILGELGEKYAKEGLPEKRMLLAIKDNPKILTEISKELGFDNNEATACLGVLKSRNAIEIRKEDLGLKISITAFGKRLLDKGFIEDKLLLKSFPIPIGRLTDSDNLLISEMSKRPKMLQKETRTFRTISLTALGKSVLGNMKDSDVIDKLTPQIISEGTFRSKKFRRFDVIAQSPRIYPGRLNHYRTFLDSVKKKFLSLGFSEMDGPIVESDFWDMDSLFMPQFHSARDIHDAYYIRSPKYAKDIPSLLAEKVKQAHENGAGSGSKGWEYEFDMKRTARQLLRTQTTACSSRMLASPNLKIPGKYFALSRVFRSDVIDATHLADFNQLEGFVIEEGLNFGHLVGLLKMFAKEIALTDEIKIAPTYFPFTEPSASLYAKHPKLGWMELGGSGIFRPEMLKPLGINVPVIAWGIGIDRIAMFRLGLTDIRQLFTSDISVIRNARMI